ncbi:MAG: cytochrome c oxidase subunit 3 [Bacteroidota bacterium]
MSSDFRIVEEPKKPLAMHPKKFAMWLFLGSVLMLFAAFTSAYIVRQAEGNWVYFELPTLFYTSTIIILLSSVTMQWAYVATKKDNLETARVMISITAVLGVGFLISQLLGWNELVQKSIHFVGNPSGSFLYVLTGLHGLHVVSAIIYLLVMLVWIFRAKVHSRNLAPAEMCATYWHFLGGLWLYLFVFLLLNR